MNKKRVLMLGLLAVMMLSVYIVLKFIIGPTITSESFPLSQKWSTQFGESVQELSLVDDQIVLIRTAGALYALNIQSGKILWENNLNWQTIEKPALSKDGIIFLADSKSVWALKESDGTVVWKQQVDSSTDTVVVDISKSLVAVYESPFLKLYQATNGTLEWSKHVCGNYIQAYFYDANIYVPCFGLIAMDISSGEIAWETKSDDRTWGAGFSDGIMYSSSDLKNITAYNLGKRTQLWSTRLANDRIEEYRINGNFLFITDPNQFCALQRDNGAVLWCVNQNHPQNPVIVENIAYIFNGPQKIITAFEITTGNKIGRLVLNNLNLSFITVNHQRLVSSDQLLIFSSGQEVFAFGR